MVLSISIPTYNRATYLDLCLETILQQIDSQNQEYIEIIVSDNNSEDDTPAIAEKHIKANEGKSIRYHRNERNIGLDGNITQAFHLAKAKFVWVFGDDDVLIPGSINRILTILMAHPGAGIVYVESFGFKGDFRSELPTKFENQYWVYRKTIPFFKRVNYYFTYTSGNIVNKSLMPDGWEINKFLGTNLNLLNWIFTSVFRSKENIYVPDKLIGMKVENTGGYGFCKTFAVNGNYVFEHFLNEGITNRHFKIINNKMLVAFFPFLINIFKDDPKRFTKENYFEELYPMYKGNIRFWFFTVPLIFLPKFLSEKWLIFNKIYKKADLFFSMIIPEIVLKSKERVRVNKL